MPIPIWEAKELLDKVERSPSSELESEVIEFKGYRDENAVYNSKDLSDELSALGNHKGGTLIIGVKDDTDVRHGDWPDQLVGISGIDPIELKERLGGKLRPSGIVSVRDMTHLGKTYVLIDIEHPRNSLVSTSSGKFYIREGRSSRPMSPEEVERAVKSLITYDWSADALEIDPIESLDPISLKDAIADFTQRRKLTGTPAESSFLESIGATRNGVLLRAGLLFLGKSDLISRYLGNFEYRFSWKTSSGQLLVNDVWSGCLWESVHRAKQHLAKCNKEEHFAYKEKTFSVPLLDETAFHEAFLNALVHRDYSSQGMVSVNFTNEALEIISPGEFYGGVTADNIALHAPRHRNPVLAKCLMSHQLVDRAGMGVLRMGLGSLKYGRSFPRFREMPESIEVAMEAKFLKSPITILALDNPDYGIPELLILNTLHGVGSVSVTSLENMLARLVSSPWESIVAAVEKVDAIELCGGPNGILVRVRDDWREFLEVGRLIRPSINSEKHVALFSYLKKWSTASNADLRAVLNYAHSSQASRFLRDAKYVERTGSGPSARWSLAAPSE